LNIYSHRRLYVDLSPVWSPVRRSNRLLRSVREKINSCAVTVVPAGLRPDHRHCHGCYRAHHRRTSIDDCCSRCTSGNRRRDDRTSRQPDTKNRVVVLHVPQPSLLSLKLLRAREYTTFLLTEIIVIVVYGSPAPAVCLWLGLGLGVVE